MTDYETLYDFKIGGTILKECSTPTFIGWVSKKLNNYVGESPMRNELTAMIMRPPMGMIGDSMKLEVIRKLEKMGIEIC